ncbi:ABC transporter substrate-binding protein [Nakamurella deserti]|uniref:ABC transporter substrate-binding protein n=1 Tax=Nakamurella deserti TaxID=2164074 RepID=UPI000DBE7C67|nr:ABC transporter substrate-binding protein [Nakamurella deserti]
MSPRSRRPLAWISALVAVTLATSACGSSTGTAADGDAAASTVAAGAIAPAADESSVPPAGGGVSFDLSPEQAGRVTVAAVPEIAALVPAEIRDKGTLVVTGSAGTAPPLRFYATDDTTIIGSEVDIAYLLGDVLGLDVQIQAADWAQNFVRVDSGEVDAFISNVTVTEERKEKYDFATYRLDNLAFEARADSTVTITKPADVAGLSIAVGSGTNQEALLVKWNEENVAAGLEAADIQYYQNATDYYLALSSGRIDLYFGPSPTAEYHAAVTGETKVVGRFSGAGDALQGKIATLTLKGNGLAEALQAAIDHTLADGSYQRVLDRWAISSEAVPSSELNPQGLPKTTG